MNSLGRYFIFVLLISIRASAIAEWTQVAKATRNESAQYIDQETIRQSGPMAIYRQVHVLTQGPALPNQGISSKLSVYEYDCMNSKLRVLETSGFSAAWAQGEKIELQPSSPTSRQWQNLPNHALGQVTFNMLCPSGKDD